MSKPTYEELERREAEWHSRYEASVTRTREEADAVRIQVLRQEKVQLEAEAAALRDALNSVIYCPILMGETAHWRDWHRNAGKPNPVDAAYTALNDTNAGKLLLAVVAAAKAEKAAHDAAKAADPNKAAKEWTEWQIAQAFLYSWIDAMERVT